MFEIVGIVNTVSRLTLLVRADNSVVTLFVSRLSLLVRTDISVLIVPRLNSLIENHELKKHSIVCINKFYIQLVGGKNLMVVLGIDVLNNSVKEKIGNHVIREVTYN